MTWGVNYLGVGDDYDDFGNGTALGNIIIEQRAPFERTPIYEAVMAARSAEANRRYWTEGPGSKRGGACPGCGRDVHRRPDGGLVRHKVTKGGEWCTAGR